MQGYAYIIEVCRKEKEVRDNKKGYERYRARRLFLLHYDPFSLLFRAQPLPSFYSIGILLS